MIFKESFGSPFFWVLFPFFDELFRGYFIIITEDSYYLQLKIKGYENKIQ